jgi:phosphoglycerate dehydrogenase-like enzyme
VPNVVFLAGDPDWLGPALRRASEGRQYAFLSPQSSAESLSGALSDAEALIARPGDVLAVQPACPRLRFVQFSSCDYDQAVLAGLQSQRLPAAALGAVLAEEVAGVTVGLMLALDAGAHTPVTPADDRWTQTLRKLQGRAVGIIGLGRVGTAVARLLAPTGAHVVYADVRTAQQGLPRQAGIRRSSQDRLLVESDFVTIHVPLTDQTRNLLGRREFGLLRGESALISTSAPEVIERQPLLAALKQRRIRGYGTTDLDPAFAANPNVVMADPRMFRTADVAARVARWIVDNVERALGGQKPHGIVETIGYPKSGDPAFWSSRMTPREAVQ